MSCLCNLRTYAATALFAALTTSSAITFAQAADEEGSAEEEATAAEDTPEAMPAEEADLDGEDTTEGDDEDDSGVGNWGRGGVDDEPGRYRPQGKTGKLAEIDEEKEKEEEVVSGPPDLPPPGFFNVDTVIGFGDITVIQNPGGATDVTPTASHVINFGYRFAEMWDVYARIPVSSGAIDGPGESTLDSDLAQDPDAFTQIAFGAVGVGATATIFLSRDLWLPLGLELDFPSGQGDPFPAADNRAALGRAHVQQAAAASRGWEDRGLFAYNRFTVTPKVGVKYDFRDVGPGRLRVAADTKVEIMARTGGSDPLTADQLSDGAVVASYNDVAINFVLGAQAGYELWEGLLTPGLRFWIPYATSFESSESLDPGGAGLVFEPSVSTHVPILEDDALGFDGKISLIAPAAGELASGNASFPTGILGFRILAGLFF
ncbi:MAG: hypothetical protein AAGA56_12895 [Myxococcota bacterium]